MPAESPSGLPGPPSEPVELVAVDRSHRAVLENLGQLYRYDLSEAYRHLPNRDGTFNNRRLDRFLAEVDPGHRAWLITAAGSLGGFVMVTPTEEEGMSIGDFFVVRALRRTGVGREAARQVIAMFPGKWRIGFQTYNPGFQTYNPGVQRFGRWWPPTPSGTPGPRTTVLRWPAGLPTPGSPSSLTPALSLDVGPQS